MNNSLSVDTAIAKNFVIDANDNKDYTKEDILATINYLINNDMEKLLFILYRVDVAEDKIRASLSLSGNEDAATIIYNHIYDRELEKAESRAKFSTSNGEFLDL